MCNKVTLSRTEYRYLIKMCEYGLVDFEQLATHFTVSKKTVNTHIRNLYAKFDVHSRAELVYKYFTHKLNYTVLGGRYDD